MTPPAAATPMPARAVALALALLALPGSAGHGPAGAVRAGTDHLGCDSFAPLEASCVDCCAEADGRIEPRVHLELYVGRVDLILAGPSGQLTWTCWSLAAPGRLGACDEDPTRTGRFERGDRVRLVCKPSATDEPGLPDHVLGPAGPFSCEATFT